MGEMVEGLGAVAPGPAEMESCDPVRAMAQVLQFAPRGHQAANAPDTDGAEFSPAERARIRRALVVLDKLTSRHGCAIARSILEEDD